ncbi:AAA family ATPase [Fusobacterium sp. HC1336]|uniref:AAA family ATPase n=1 Tax=Fusobacterium sp. HC1336 TaxID=3171169 RepID=UPI003F1E95FB
MSIKDSRWISRFEDDLDKKQIFCLYGNIDDYFFYDRNISSLKDFLKKRFKENILYFFDTDHFENILESLENIEEQEYEATGYNLRDFLKFVEKIKKSSKEYIVIKDPKLFFGDLCSGTTSYSLRYFLENISSKGFEDKKIIFISEELGDFPEKLTVNNPYTTVLYVDYPEEDERREYLKNYPEITKILTDNDNEEARENLEIFVKLTTRRKLKDLENILKKSEELKESEEKKSIKDIINYYDFGKKESPWTKLKKSVIQNLEKKLKERVKGQDEAIDFIKKVVYRANLNLNGIMQKYSTKPMGVMFFTGPSGVGKTELAKALTECIFGDESAFKRFDMSEYKSEESINKLIGSDPGYVGYNEGGQLTNWVMQNPYSVILFDEIDKANVKIWDTFLQILEDGRLTDNKGNTVYFSESIIIFTSNIGNKEYNDEVTNPKEHYLNALNKYFEEKVGRVEILNRFGENKIVFNHIEEEVFKEIVENKLDLTVRNIEKKMPNIKFKFENREEVKELIFSRMGDSKKFGARLVNSLLENLFINEFATFYMEQGITGEELIIIKVEGDKIKFQC